MFVEIKQEYQSITKCGLNILASLIAGGGEIQNTKKLVQQLEILEEHEVQIHLRSLQQNLLIKESSVVPEIQLTSNGLVRFTIERCVKNNILDLDSLIKNHLTMILLFTLIKSPEGLRKSFALSPFQNQLKIYGIRLVERQFKSVIENTFHQKYIEKKLVGKQSYYIITDLGSKKVLQDMRDFASVTPKF
jgi:hypothetical protein